MKKEKKSHFRRNFISAPEYCISVPIFVSSVFFSKQNIAEHRTFASLIFFKFYKVKVMKSVLSNQISKAVVDILLFAGIFISIVFSRKVGSASFDVGEMMVKIHHDIAHIFFVVMIVHSIQKSKRFVQLFKGTGTKTRHIFLEMRKQWAVFCAVLAQMVVNFKL